jgi:ABC-type transporter Mla subunit MlaD
MEENEMSEDFLDMHKEAEELVSSLKKLNAEVRSYKSSKEQLEDLNNKLSGFIEETMKLTEKSAKVIENTANLTPTKIDNKVEDIRKRLDKFEELINKTIDRIDRNEISIITQLRLLTKSIEENSDVIKNKKFSLFGNK